MLRAGAGIADITPPQGLALAGYPHYERNNTGAHDPLYAACLYLSDGNEELALVTLDLLFFSKIHVKAVRKKVCEHTGMKPEAIMISCIHTHSGPWASGRLDIEGIESGVPQPLAYIEEIVDTIAGLIIKARDEAFPAQICAGTAVCGAESGIGGNRRIAGGPHDPLVSVIAVRDMQQKVRGIFVNYTLHPTFIHEWSTVCTAE